MNIGMVSDGSARHCLCREQIRHGLGHRGMTNDATATNRGMVVSIRRSVVDVHLAQRLPAIETVPRAGEKHEIVEFPHDHSTPRFF